MTSNLKRLYVTKFPLGMTAQQLGSIFEKIGPIFECRIPFQRQYAFVEYLEPEDAQTAMTEMNEITFGVDKLVVSWATSRNHQSYVQKEGAFKPWKGDRRMPRYSMPTDDVEDLSKGDSSLSNRTNASQQSPEESSCGRDDDEQKKAVTENTIHRTSTEGEEHSKDGCEWSSEAQRCFDFKQIVIPFNGISRNRSEVDVHMLDNVEKRTMKQSGSEPCLSKRKRSFDAAGEDANYEQHKRIHEEQGW